MVSVPVIIDFSHYEVHVFRAKLCLYSMEPVHITDADFSITLAIQL